MLWFAEQALILDNKFLLNITKFDTNLTLCLASFELIKHRSLFTNFVRVAVVCNCTDTSSLISSKRLKKLISLIYCIADKYQNFVQL